MSAPSTPTWRTRYRIDSIIPAPRGWHAVFAVLTGEDGRRWIELEARPVLSLATVTVYQTQRIDYGEPTEDDELADAEVLVHGVVVDEGVRMDVAPRCDYGAFVGYADADQPLEPWLSEVSNPDGLPIVIPTPEQLQERERAWAAELRAKHNVIEAPWASREASA